MHHRVETDWKLFAWGLCVAWLVGCESAEEKSERLMQQFETLPGYEQALLEGLASAAADSGLSVGAPLDKPEDFHELDKRKVKEGLRRLCLAAGKVLSKDPLADLRQGGVPDSSPQLRTLVGSEGFRSTCVQLWETRQH